MGARTTNRHIGKTLAISALIFTLYANTSCSGNKEAKGLVKEFLTDNLKSKDYEMEYFSKIDSTFVVGDSMLQVMQEKAKTLPMFKNVEFGNRGKSKKLKYIRVRYHVDGDTVRQTFYFDDMTTTVVGVKQDI